MIDLQILNVLLNTKDYSIISNNNLTVEYFPKYKDEFTYIEEHYKKYGIIPDKETFVDRFPNFNFIDVQDSSKYLIDGIREEYLYNKAFPILEKAAKLLTGENADSRKAIEYLTEKLPTLNTNVGIDAVDLVHEGAKQRLEEYLDKVNNPNKYYLSTGLPELDEVICGFDKKEDYVVIAARPGIGKSFMMSTFALHHVRLGLKVGLYSGEMTENKVGYRIDTLFSGISNFSIMKGRESVKEEYIKAINDIQQLKGKFYTITPKMIGGFANVSALRSFCEKYKLDILYIDQLSLLNDVDTRTQSRSEKFSNISRAIKELQTQLKIPIITNSQLNRDLEKGEDPDLSNISNSDTIGQDVTLAFTLQKKDDNVILQIIKNRDGVVGNKLTYHWDVDKGKLTFIPTENDATGGKYVEDLENKYNKTGSEVF